MSQTTDATLTFLAVTQAGRKTWSRPERLDFLDSLATLPAADTEILHLAHYAPLAIRFGQAGPEVVLVLHPALKRPTLVNAEGRWVPPYTPLAIRALPFRNAAKGDEPEFAPGLCDPSSKQFRFTTSGGKATAELAQTLELLQRLARGRIRLGNAVRLLVAADLLLPFHPVPGFPSLELASIAGDRVNQLTAKRAAGLTADMNLPFELAAALIFSQRWLAPNVLAPLDPEPGERYQARAPDPVITDDPLAQPIQLDDSSLFSIDDFLSSLRADS